MSRLDIALGAYALGFATPVVLHWIAIQRDPWERRQRLRKRLRRR